MGGEADKRPYEKALAVETVLPAQVAPELKWEQQRGSQRFSPFLVNGLVAAKVFGREKYTREHALSVTEVSDGAMVNRTTRTENPKGNKKRDDGGKGGAIKNKNSEKVKKRKA